MIRRIIAVGNQTSHEPSTGIIDTRDATTVKTKTLGTPKKNSPAPKARPCMTPMKTCPKIIAFVIPLNSFRNFSSVAFENGESVDVYCLSLSASFVAKKNVNRNTANWRSKEGRLTSMAVNCLRNAVNVCPIMLSMFRAIVEVISVSMKPLTTSAMLRF